MNTNKNKILIAAGVGVVLLLLLTVAVIMGTSPKKKSDAGVTYENSAGTISPQPTGARTYTPAPTSLPDSAEAIQAAVKQQQQVDAEYSTWQTKTREDYPWRKALPLHDQKYYVYFDLNRKVFIGLLYPRKGEQVESLKTLIVKILKDQKQIPVDDFTFEWKVTPE